MIIKVNNKEMELSNQASLQQLAETLQMPDKGVAVAVNNQMIPRTKWSETILQENDQVVVIKAACGRRK